MHELKDPFFIYRIYSENTILRELGEIPSDSTEIPLPSLLESLIGRFYVVSPETKQDIGGIPLSDVIWGMQIAAARAEQRTAYPIKY